MASMLQIFAVLALSIGTLCASGEHVISLSSSCSLYSNTTLVCSNGSDITRTLNSLMYQNEVKFRDDITAINIRDFNDSTHSFLDLHIFKSLKSILFHSVVFSCRCSLLFFKSPPGWLAKVDLGESPTCVWGNGTSTRIMELQSYMFPNCDEVEVSVLTSVSATIGDPLTIYCNVTRGSTPHWYKIYHRSQVPNVIDGRYSIDNRLNRSFVNESFHIENVTIEDAGCYLCIAWNEVGFYQFNDTVLTVERAAPTILNLSISMESSIDILSILVLGSTPIHLRWSVNGEKDLQTDDFLSKIENRSDNSCAATSKVDLVGVIKSTLHKGDVLRLYARNDFGSHDLNLTVQGLTGIQNPLSFNNPDHTTIKRVDRMMWNSSDIRLEIVLPVVLSVIIILIALITIGIVRARKLRDKNRRGGDTARGATESLPLTFFTDMKDNPDYDKMNQHQSLRVFKTDQLNVVRQLGEGAFGIVYQGTCQNLTHDDEIAMVAIKTTKETATKQVIHDFEVEAEVMADVTHPNIVRFYGICYNGERLMMVFEYMEHGDLNNFLRSHGPDAAALGYPARVGRDTLERKDLLQMVLHVAQAMAYLAGRHFVHRDLATRNCLVGQQRIVKIGDFGMSRDIYATDYYKIGDDALLPIRWMPPESVLYRTFSVQSDIWSFGVLLWEVFTFGMQPWCELSNSEVMESVKDGKVLSAPSGCPREVHELMLGCWKTKPSDRVTMEVVVGQLEHILDSGSRVQIHNNNSCIT